MHRRFGGKYAVCSTDPDETETVAGNAVTSPFSGTVLGVPRAGETVRGGFPFAVTADNAELVKAKALSRLAKELQAAEDDPTSYPEEEVYKLFGVEA